MSTAPQNDSAASAKSENLHSVSALADKAQQVWRWVRMTHTWRTWDRYNTRRGRLLAGGLGFISVLTLGSVMAVALTVMNSVLGSRPALMGRFVVTIDRQLPGLFSINGSDGLVIPEDFIRFDLGSIAGIIALVVAVWAGLGWFNGAREGIRAMFDLEPNTDFVLLKKLRDLGVMLLLGGAVLLSTVAGVAASLVTTFALGSVGSDVQRVGVQTASFLVVLVFDIVMMAVLLRVLTGLGIPRGDLLRGAVFGALGMGLLKLFGGALLSNVGNGNPLFAGSATLVGLVVWLNLMSQLLIFTGAYTATSNSVEHMMALQRAPEGSGIVESKVVAVPDHPEPIGPSMDAERHEMGRRNRDRLTLAAGVVIGASILTGVRAAAALTRRMRH